MTLGKLKAAIRATAHPERLPGFENIGSGIMRTAYSNGVFVIKGARTTPDYIAYKRKFVAEFRATGNRLMRFAPIVTVKDKRGNAWEIQLRYQRIASSWQPTQDENVPHFSRVEQGVFALVATLLTSADLHDGNLGRDRRGRLVAFDW